MIAGCRELARTLYRQTGEDARRTKPGSQARERVIRGYLLSAVPELVLLATGRTVQRQAEELAGVPYRKPKARRQRLPVPIVEAEFEEGDK
jgi:hypothetical protein